MTRCPGRCGGGKETAVGEPSGDRGEAAEEWAQGGEETAMLAALADGWKRDRAMRHDLRDSMATEGNRSYQEGYADALGQCILAAERGSVGLVAAEGDVPTPAGEAGRPADMGKRHG